MNTFGTHLRLTVFGTSHGPEVGGELSGVPRGTPIDVPAIQTALDRRRPGRRSVSSRRQEPDRLRIESGIEEGRATGEPIRGSVANVDVDRAAYEELRYVPRPGHADFPARTRFGETADLSGGGLFSGRMTVGMVMAGGIAAQIWSRRGVRFVGFTRAIAGVVADVPEDLAPEELAGRRAASESECPDPERAREMLEAIGAARRAGDSVGGVVEVRGFGLPVGIGEPFFDSVESELGHLLYAIPSVKGVEFGEGFAAAERRGSEHNDPYDWRAGRPAPRTNHSGGALGGLTTGAPVVVRIAIKPTPSIARPQDSVDLRTGTPTRLVVKGRHDPCIVPRAVVVAESACALGLADLAFRGGFLP